ncbi:MAG TPA: hypothetical protein VMD30_12770 [Tepidisphaeraceae bacterium]|nr:hypothetical protein [Tepidisphaeraceae bacterium]
MPTITPLVLLWSLLLLTAAAWIGQRIFDCLRIRKMARWARSAHLFYSPTDHLGIAPRIARLLDIPGAAAVRVTDLMYRSDGQRQDCLFTISYTRGVMSHRVQGIRVASLQDSITRGDPSHPLQLRLAPDRLPTLRQYEFLLDQLPAKA